MTVEKVEVPRGMWLNSDGGFTPISKIKDIDKDRDAVVRQLCGKALEASAALLAFKTSAMQFFNEFVDRSLAEYDAKLGGKKGNVTLHSYDGSYKIIRQIAETLVFDERLQVAQSLISECIHTWSKGSNENIKAIVDQAFKTDKAGKINTGAVLNLRALKITDEKWLRAMDAISDSIKSVGTKAHIRFYYRDALSGEYVAIPLDAASV
ncbi:MULTISPECIES: DUF3164 family protein [unclassified Polaromonas]|jgi:hypothetical protein|uniref:DUF3164 family protein n=1 Tax=unclassified Polaromonas TaxID=2638319 RepID=UPI000BD48A92|nr:MULTISPECIES: DUF3164 family protein [unclassified Polaromonas]OYZ76074.1 MAG: sulfate transporter [Polaromonas sp. 24-63-21]OZA47361.1 MAG: sulfate transporter [Polaromonas sp. 17-63-33]